MSVLIYNQSNNFYHLKTGVSRRLYVDNKIENLPMKDFHKNTKSFQPDLYSVLREKKWGTKSCDPVPIRTQCRTSHDILDYRFSSEQSTFKHFTFPEFLNI